MAYPRTQAGVGFSVLTRALCPLVLPRGGNILQDRRCIPCPARSQDEPHARPHARQAGSGRNLLLSGPGSLPGGGGDGSGGHGASGGLCSGRPAGARGPVRQEGNAQGPPHSRGWKRVRGTDRGPRQQSEVPRNQSWIRAGITSHPGCGAPTLLTTTSALGLCVRT